MKVCETTNYIDNIQIQPPSRLERWVLTRLKRHLAKVDGCLLLTLPSGTQHQFGKGDPVADLRIHTLKAFLRMFLGGANGWAESYIAGEWDSNNIGKLVQWALTNELHLADMSKASFVIQTLHNHYHARRENTKAGSKRNISAHYDLGNDFYSLWLDETMTYSSALYRQKSDSLAQAQFQKYEQILNLLSPQPGDNILEIGCGWGGFARQASKERGAHVHGITLSTEQLAWAKAQEKTQLDGVSGDMSFSLTDYRDVDAQYDHIVSIEMFEAVGMAHWDSYFETLKRTLKPDGRAVLQIITIDDKRFDKYQTQADFIQRYVFPGGMLPSVEKLKLCFQKHGLQLDTQYMFGKDYAQTLREWADKFEAQWPNIKPLGYDERFRRLWRYYLSYCEGGFDYGSIDVGLFALSHAPAK